MRRWLIYITLFLAAPALAEGVAQGAARPETPVLIVDRRADAISLYFSLPAGELESVFGQGAQGLLDAAGTVDIDALYEGTFELADQIFEPVRAMSGPAELTFEATSMMVHDPAVLPPFETPWDGETSIAVCTSPDTVDNLGLESLQAYLGFFAWKVNGLAPLVLEFPDVTPGGTVFEIREFWNMQHTGTRVVELGQGRMLELKPGEGSAGLGAATLWLISGAFLALGVVFLALHMRRPTSPADTA